MSSMFRVTIIEAVDCKVEIAVPGLARLGYRTEDAPVVAAIATRIEAAYLDPSDLLWSEAIEESEYTHERPYNYHGDTYAEHHLVKTVVAKFPTGIRVSREDYWNDECEQHARTIEQRTQLSIPITEYQAVMKIIRESETEIADRRFVDNVEAEEWSF